MALGPHDSWCYETRTGRPQVIENSSATALLGLAGMAVLAVSGGDGEVEYAIETTARVGWCPTCGAQARLHNRRPTWVRDLPAGDRAVTLVWVKRIWRCVHLECEQQTWTESYPQIRPRASWTERARKQACRRVGREGHSVAAVARDFGVGWAAVMAAVIEYGYPLIEHPDRIDGVAAVGVDETAFARANPIRSTRFATGIVDLHRGKLIDIIPGRSRKVLADWLISQPAEWTAGIGVAALDPFRGYSAALSTGLPHAVRVLDAFHVVRLGSPPSTTCAAVCNNRPAGIGAAALIRCTGSAGCCAAALRIFPPTRGRGCWRASRPATSTVRSPPPGSRPKSCARSTTAAIVTRPPPASTPGR